MSSGLELVEFTLGQRDLVDRFIRVPWYIHREYHPNTHWVPPLLMDRRHFLDPARNPLFEHVAAAFWLARLGGRDVGRIAAIDDADYEGAHGERVGYFGMFESPNEPAIAAALVNRSCAWLKKRGCERVIGPLDFSTHYTCGTLVDHFDRDPGMNMPYNPPYYDALLRSCGFEKAKDLWQWDYDVRTPVPERIVRLAERIKARDRVRVRTIDFRDWDAEVMRTREIYNEAWQHNWGFVPIRENEFHHIARDLKLVLHPSLALIAEVDGTPVGVALTIMNVNPILKKLDGKLFPTGLLRLIWGVKVHPTMHTGRLVVLGIRSGYRRRGIDALLFVATHRAAERLGWHSGEIGWTLEDNELVNRAIKAMGSSRIGTYRIFGRTL